MFHKMILAMAFFAAAATQAAPAAADEEFEAGKKIFNRCKACHQLEAGKHRLGPSLHGIFGREAGAVEGFKYSKAMLESDVVWDEETLDAYLANPREFMPGNRMSFPGLKDEEDREAVLEYLEEATE